MKIRNGFVTNSSSTSFVISLKKDWEKEAFMSAVGADGVSPANWIFEDLFEAIDQRKKEIHRAMKDSGAGGITVSEFLEEEGFDPETVEIVEKLIADGRTVYYGELHSTGENAEVYFCCRSFVICEDDIYFNGSIGGW